MCEACSDGSIIWAAIPRLAAYSKLSERQVQRLLPDLCHRGILSQLAPANSNAKRLPATYRINEAALEDDPRMVLYRIRQQQFSGMRLVATPGEPVTPCHPTGDTMSPVPVTPCRETGDTMSPDSKAFDSSTSDSKTTTHHGFAVLKTLKEQLRKELSPEEWELWVRPARLERMMNGNTMLIAVPPNGAIISAAAARKKLVNELARHAGMNGAQLTVYANDWQRNQLKERFEIA